MEKGKEGGAITKEEFREKLNLSLIQNYL